MTPRAINDFTKQYFPYRDIQSWGTTKSNYWHSIYGRTRRLLAAVPKAKLDAELADNDNRKPFTIWAILKKTT